MDKWDARFMELAGVISGWASCYMPDRKIGAVIVKNKRIVTTGYNGAPAGIKTCVERGECLREKLGIASGTRHEICYAVHAEQNAIMAAGRDRCIGATMYIYGFDRETGELVAKPDSCQMCKRAIINSGIETVCFALGKEDIRTALVKDWIANGDAEPNPDGY